VLAAAAATVLAVLAAVITAGAAAVARLAADRAAVSKGKHSQESHHYCARISEYLPEEPNAG
jgi:hypothetical protein